MAEHFTITLTVDRTLMAKSIRHGESEYDCALRLSGLMAIPEPSEKKARRPRFRPTANG